MRSLPYLACIVLIVFSNVSVANWELLALMQRMAWNVYSLKGVVSF